MKTLSLEADNKIELPPDWVAELGLESGVVLEKTDDGILIRPYPSQTGDEVYAKKLKIGGTSVLYQINPICSARSLCLAMLT